MLDAARDLVSGRVGSVPAASTDAERGTVVAIGEAVRDQVGERIGLEQREGGVGTTANRGEQSDAGVDATNRTRRHVVTAGPVDG